jgi:hypothetical protein
MHAGGREKRVTFNVNDLAVDSTDLARWAHDRQLVVEPGAGKFYAATIYYETVAQAQELYAYLVHHAPCDDKIAWQQDRAHLEIQGWCQLCEAANQGECRGWCLLDLTSKEYGDLPSFRPTDCQDKNSERK